MSQLCHKPLCLHVPNMPECIIYQSDLCHLLLAHLSIYKRSMSCVSTNVNLGVVKCYFVSRREEFGQTDDISTSYLDSRSPNSDFDQSPLSGFYFLSLPVLILATSYILLTLCSVGLSLYLQSRFSYTFDNQIIYVIKKHKNIYIYL